MSHLEDSSRTTILIRRSKIKGLPVEEGTGKSLLQVGEQAISFLPDPNDDGLGNGGDRLYIGAGDVVREELNVGTADSATHFYSSEIITIGGKYFTDMMDHQRGTLTPSSAILVNDSANIDRLLVDNLRLDADSVSTSQGTLSLRGADGNVRVKSNLQVDGTLTVDGIATFKAGSSGSIQMGDSNTDNVVFGADINSRLVPNIADVYDLGDSVQRWRDIYAKNLVIDSASIGSVEIADDLLVTGNLTVEGITALDSTTIDGTLVVTDSANVGNLTTAGNLVAGGNLSLTGNAVITGSLDVDGPTTLDSVSIEGNLIVPGDLTVNGITTLDSTTIDGDLTVTKNLTVLGDTTNISTTELKVEDKRIVIADGATSSTIANGAGIAVGDSVSPYATITYVDNGTDSARWEFEPKIYAPEIEFDTIDCGDYYYGTGGTVTSSSSSTSSTGSLNISSIQDLNDIQLTNVQNGQVIKYSDGNWINANDLTGAGGGVSLTDISVSQATAAGGGTLSYNNVNGVFTYTPPDLSSYLTSFTETNDLTAAVTWANVPDANITQSSVTQHQAALSITQSQISDLTFPEGGVSSLSLLDSVTIDTGTLTTGQALKWSGSAWTNQDDDAAASNAWSQINLAGDAGSFDTINAGTPNFSLTISLYGGLKATAPANGSLILRGDQVVPSSSIMQHRDADSNGVALDASNGQGKILAWDQTALAFVPVDQTGGSGGVSSLSLLDSVSIDNISLSTGQVLKWNGSTWTNQADATGSGSGLATRGTLTGVSASIANNDSDDVDILNSYTTFALLKVETSAAAWVRIYTDDTSRTSDDARLITDDPAPNAGVIAEVITTGAETVNIAPGVIGWINGGTTLPLSVTNLSGVSQAITTTLTAVNLEA